ncbi:uncharacterized protein LOC127710496 [Mytilus californianus]|uniref:uncharacterized protein LOC127710496 n=1 Tax=Mytilus californianus TaxID=6549 RepID=UPI0022461E4F|nr:uncharacterized protein LOC127710496 [Mytilus californianus]
MKIVAYLSILVMLVCTQQVLGKPDEDCVKECKNNFSKGCAEKIPGCIKTCAHWTTVFVACPGNGKSIWDAWKDNVGVSFDSSGVYLDADTCKTSHQSDPNINKWQSGSIDQVRLRLWKKDSIVVEMTFNGTNTDKFNWFAPSRLLASTYQDMMDVNANFSFFKAKGYAGTNINRRFYINKSNYKGCAADAGWMFVKDVGTSHCLYDKYKKYPYFLYATNNHSGVWQTNGDYDMADMMSIEVHFHK